MSALSRQLQVAGLFTCLLLSGCRPSPANPKAVEQQLALVVPAHSSQAQVMEYLSSQKVPHSAYHRDSTNGNVIDSVITIKTPHIWMGPDYDVLFLFDDSGHLLKYHVDYLGYLGL